jgi:hypothetical protein
VANAPEISRLVPELFRRVGIPYYQGFAPDGQRALSGIVEIGLAGARIARKQTVDLRLRRELGGSSHLDEFAVAFGFLEEASGNYFAGKFGLVGRYLSDVAQRERHFNLDRARHAMLTYAVLERHGDCVLPTIAVLGSARRQGDFEFKRRMQSLLQRKAETWRDGDLPRNAAYREGVRLYSIYVHEWRIPPLWPTRASGLGIYGKKPNQLDDKTIDGYFGRTVAYLNSLELAIPSSLTDKGISLARCLDDGGFAPDGDIGLSPSFETIHDAFSIDFGRYRDIFKPATQGTFERLAASVSLPGRALVDWHDVPNIETEYAAIVEALSESLSGSARLDAVRLALFLYSVGLGVPGDLDGEASPEELNSDAAVIIARDNPRRFGLGHARSGRRFWSVTILRR